MSNIAILNLLALKFTSSNDVPVQSTRLTRDEYEAYLKLLSSKDETINTLKEELQDCKDAIHRHIDNHGFTATFLNETTKESN